MEYTELAKKIDELGEQIEESSMTYWGALLIRIIKCCREKVFKDEISLRKFINNALDGKLETKRQRPPQKRTRK